MIAIHGIDRTNRADYEAQIEEQFRIRHEIYVGERGWKALARSDGREIDAFDTADAIYLLGMTDDGQVVAGSRLVPSLKPHLMSEVFPALAPAGVPRAADIFEWTRIFVVPALRSKGRPCRAAGIVYCGILEYCLLRKINRLSVVCEPYWYQRLERLGWSPRLLGDPILHDGEPVVGITVEITNSALETTRRKYGITHSVLWRQTAGAISRRRRCAEVISPG